MNARIIWSSGRLVWWVRLFGAAALVAGCGVPTGDGSFGTIDVEDVPIGLNDSTTTSTSTTTTTTTMPEAPESTVESTTTSSTLPSMIVNMYFISRGSLERVERELPPGFGPNQLVALLEEGPPPGPLGAALQTFVSQGLIVGQPREEFGVINVTLDSVRFDEIQVRDQREALAQIVLTLLSNTTGVGQVAFLIGDDPLPIPTDSGAKFTASVQDFDRLLGSSRTSTDPVEPDDTVAPTEPTEPVDGVTTESATTIA